MNEEAGTPQEKLTQAVGRVYRQDEVPWLEADLDGNGENEFIIVRGVQDDTKRPVVAQGAAVFVIYRKDGAWAVDRTDPMDERLEFELMAPHLHAVSDLMGTGHPEIIWFRPETIATGPQPFYVFVTAWQPGRFTHIPGQMAISSIQLHLDGRDLVLKGNTRNNTYLPVMERTDRYRYMDGAFRLVDRQFSRHPDNGYALLWDALVAEETGRVKDAETAYRQVLDPAMPVHSGVILGYKMEPRKLTADQMQQFGQALRAFARFRLGALLLEADRAEEAAVVLKPGGEVYQGLFEAVRQAPDRGAACQAGQAWAAAAPAFLKALNIGVGTSPWTADLMCSHIDINDHGFWER